MKINLIALARKVFENPIIENIDRDKVKIHYRARYSKPKPMTLPRFVVLDEELAEGIGLYVGDGTLTKNKLHQTDISTIDEDMGKFMLDFFLKRFNIEKKDITFTIRYRTGNKDDLRNKWSKILDVEKGRFHFQKRNKYKMKDSISIQINSIVFRKIFQEVIEIALSRIKYIRELRHAFLRGFFAADGKLGVEKDTNIYVSEISFCYDIKKESWLRDYIIDCLKLDGINKFSFSNDGDIRITNWKNYIKFWEMKIFDRCIRKKNKFLNVVKQMQVRLALDKDFLMKFLKSTKLTNSEIRKLVNLHRTNLKRVLSGIQLLKLEQICKLLSLSAFKWKDIINNTTNIRIGRLTNLNPTSDFLYFLLNEKDLN